MIPPTSTSSTASPRQRAAQRQIVAFRQKFGDAHLYFSYHAAFPIALTPESLYQLWANFQTDQTGIFLNIPWIAVADLLLSGLCREVGHELYEMDTTVRMELLKQLQNEPRFGPPRIHQLAEFVLSYIHHQLYSPDLDVREVALTQRWTALAYTRPGTMTRELIEAMADIPLNQSAEWLRITSLIETFAEPLKEFQPLLAYARGMKSFFHRHMEDATVQLQTLSEAGQIILGGTELPIPEQIRRNFIAEEGRDQLQLPQNLVAGTSSAASNLAISSISDTRAPIIKLHIKLTPDDIVKAQYFHIRKSLSILTISIVFFLLLVISVFISKIILFLTSGDLNYLGALFPELCILSCFYYLLYIYFPRRIRHDFKKTKILRVDEDLTISPKVVEVTSEIAMTRYQIADCYMYRANSKFILLYLSMPTVYLVLPLCILLPRRCFNTDQDFQQLLVYLKAVLGKPGKPLKQKSFSPRNLPYQAYSSFESTISFRVQLTSEDYLKSNYLHLRPGPIQKRIYYALLGIYLVLVASTGYSAILSGSNIGVFIFWLLLGGFALYWYFISLPSSVRRLSKQNAYLLFEHQVEISPEILEITEVNGTTRIRLADYIKYKFDQDLVILYVTDRAFHIFPRRCFSTESNFKKFLTYLQNNLGAPQP
ncbi:YcxB family protein [Leptothoe sp. EHU-05/26/07-4]